MRILYKLSLLLLISFFLIFNAYSQQLSEKQQAIINTYKEKLKLSQTDNRLPDQAKYLNKIAYKYWEYKFYDKAITNFNTSLGVNKTIGNKNAIKGIYYNLGLIYSDNEEYDNALKNFDKGIEYAKLLKQKGDVYSGLINKSTTLKNLAKNNQAILTLNKAFNLAKELNKKELIRTCYGMLAENYELIGDSKNAIKYYDLFASIDRHIKGKEITKIKKQSNVKVQQAQKEQVKQEKELDLTSGILNKTKDSLKITTKLNQLNELTIKKRNAELRAERIIRNSLIGGVFITLFFSVLIFFQFREKKKVNKKLSKQNDKIKKQKQEIEIQRDIANQQKHKITDSIHYAKRIQDALLPPSYFIKRTLNEHFILFKPRDIVSGDFFWLMNKEDKLIIAAADCTGHGVPGAFLSMLGTSFLNEITNKIVDNKHIQALQANDILNQLRTYIIDSLHQNTRDNESKDGIDIAICIVDFKNRKMQYAGAHNPLILIRNNEIIQIKGDRMPVSIHRNSDKSFTNHELDIYKDDCVYIFSDGFSDQIGGEKNRKFMSRNFKKLLLKIHDKPMEEQRQILDTTIEDWKGGFQQLDDILVVGFKPQILKQNISVSKTYDWSSFSILIAEDVDMNFLFLSEALKSTGINILRAINGQEAIDICKSNEKINLVLMDINMPKISGFEATEIIKKERNIPIIAQTALNIEEANEKAQEAGCDDVILKPIKLKVFLSKLNKYLN
ncbi:MAG: response regulator [Bacteroidales bacterium]|jgi:CheY-like chemotaxis protein/serine phosphatase RsbU (regulator of sigma subunit)|nr:response regulator [Bacteroidales bacterium]